MNQNPEQLSRDRIDDLLTASKWILQHKNTVNLAAGIGVAIREYQTDVGPADYVLFVARKPVGIIEAKREEEGVRLTMHGEQSTEYASAKLKYINNNPLPFVYESTGKVPGLLTTATRSPGQGLCLPFIVRRHLRITIKRYSNQND